MRKRQRITNFMKENIKTAKNKIIQATPLIEKRI